ncbi:hypothetical protein B0I35DRAFT_476415 [Stachybotrys elegans]|uniref:Uncharacterized protein n=1 Tax=Stachybotrys elegans TaxID=80388 RepID=A0A8K0SV27_9HYPO|nr:hypothetical protein B0I35DRAFT_476415 [Stachybotrys elegans]
MLMSSVFTALAGLFAVTSAQRLTKPVIQPETPSFESGLFNSLRPHQSNIGQWEWGWIPLRCHDVAIAEGFNPYDIEVYDVFYDDCGSAWVFCRHHDAEMDLTSMRDVFGRMPARTRQYVRTIMALPGTRSAYTFSDLGDVVFFGDCHRYPTVFIHEIGHILDVHGVPGHTGSRFSLGQIWLDNYNLDPRICNEYAQTKNWAQEVVVGMYDKVVPGGLGAIQPNWNDIFHQYATVQGYLGNAIIPGGTCDFRWPNE